MIVYRTQWVGWTRDLIEGEEGKKSESAIPCTLWWPMKIMHENKHVAPDTLVHVVEDE
jgi:hypothetical protein